jgi:hypothetical protein
VFPGLRQGTRAGLDSAVWRRILASPSESTEIVGRASRSIAVAACATCARFACSAPAGRCAGGGIGRRRCRLRHIETVSTRTASSIVRAHTRPGSRIQTPVRSSFVSEFTRSANKVATWRATAVPLAVDPFCADAGPSRSSREPPPRALSRCRAAGW